MKTQKDCAYVILEAAEKKGEPIEWKEIVEAVKAAGFKQTKKRDWLWVRGALQMLKDNQIMARVKDVHKERYELLPC